MWERYRQVIVTLIVALLAAISTYYTTLTSLKIEMAGKAEDKFVTTLDKRISNLEVRLAGHFATKDDFFRLREDVITRLIRIEAQLNQREKDAKNR
jgi:hypothetical protein